MPKKFDEKSGWLAEALSILFFAAVVAAANGFKLFYILFPELGAVASDVLIRPAGKWARSLWKLVVTPVLTGAIGICIGRTLPYGALTILLVMTLSIGVLRVLRSAVAPAISAGVLPIVLNVTSWLYPLCILCSLSVLALLLLLWRKTSVGKSLVPNEAPDRKAIEVLESPPNGKLWFPSLFLFVAIVGSIAQLTAWRFILFPPLIVMAYEMLGHPETCPWVMAPITFPAVCSLAALVGVEGCNWLGVTPVATSIVLGVTFGILKSFRLRMPPALAIGLIPFVLPNPSLKYPISVAFGTCALSTWFFLHKQVVRKVAKGGST